MTHCGTSALNHHLHDGFIIFRYKQLNTIVRHVDVGWHMINEMRVLKLWKTARESPPALSVSERTSHSKKKLKLANLSVAVPRPGGLILLLCCEELLFVFVHVRLPNMHKTPPDVDF